MSKGVPAKSRDIGANRFEGGLKVNLRLTKRSVNDWHHTDSSSWQLRVTTADRRHPDPVAPYDYLRGVLDGGPQRNPRRVRRGGGRLHDSNGQMTWLIQQK